MLTTCVIWEQTELLSLFAWNPNVQVSLRFTVKAGEKLGQVNWIAWMHYCKEADNRFEWLWVQSLFSFLKWTLLKCGLPCWKAGWISSLMTSAQALYRMWRLRIMPKMCCYFNSSCHNGFSTGVGVEGCVCGRESGNIYTSSGLKGSVHSGVG